VSDDVMKVIFAPLDGLLILSWSTSGIARLGQGLRLRFQMLRFKRGKNLVKTMHTKNIKWGTKRLPLH